MYRSAETTRSNDNFHFEAKTKNLATFCFYNIYLNMGIYFVYLIQYIEIYYLKIAIMQAYYIFIELLKYLVYKTKHT